VPPGVRRELARVVVAHARERQVVGRQRVPFLARNFAGFAADAHRGVGEEAVLLAGFYANAGGLFRLLGF